MKPTRERILSLYNFDSETGVFTNRDRPGKRPGEVAGYGYGFRSRYWGIYIDGKTYMAHVLVWFLVHGEWPETDIDHIDRNRRNNSPDNLRKATRPQNSANANLQKNNKSGVRGVWWHKGAEKWCAEIWVDGKKRYLGLFTDKTEAASAYAKEARKVWGEYANV